MKKVLISITVLCIMLTFAACCNCCCNCCQDKEDDTQAIERAKKNATLQEARNGYTEAYADDIQDGVIDGTTDGTTAISDTNYTVDAGAATYEYTARGYTATFDGTDWTVTPAKI